MLSPLSPAKFLELERQQDRLVESMLVLKVNNCNAVDVAAQEFITWHARVLQVEGGEDHVKNSIELVVNALRPGLDVCLKSTCSVCLGTPPGNKQSVDAFLIHAFYAEQLASIAGDSSAASRWQQLGDSCAEHAGRPLPHPIMCDTCGISPEDTAEAPVCP